MRSLFIFLLAGYAVRCDENNYYVVEMLDDPPTQIQKPFKVYWNVPTMQCASKKVYFDNLFEKYGIIQNDNDTFKGDKVTILYDPGFFPALFKNETSGKFRFRNGGVPQQGNLTKHLDAFIDDLDTSIADKNFTGIGVIDFESWRPVFRENFGDLVPYKNVSYAIEAKLHWWWNKTWIEEEAKRRFEAAARTFMQATLSVAKQLRPLASWGFYAYPYCFNMASNNMVETCATNVPEENDQISWLWSESTALYPSVYSSSSLNTSQLESLIRGRVREASRVGNGDPILPYFWFRYRDAGYFNETDLNAALATMYKSNASGTIIWGSSSDVNTVAKCSNLLTYVETVLGPAVAKYTKLSNISNDEINIEQTTLSSNNVSTDSPQFNNSVTVADVNDSVLQNNSILVSNSSVDNITISDNSTTKMNTTSQSEDIGLINSTTEINENVTSTETSRIASNLITNSSSVTEINDTSTQADSTIVDTTTISVETNTTEKIEAQTKDLVESNITSLLGIIETVSEITTTNNTDVNDMTEQYYEATLDDEDDYFFNYDTFETDYTTTDNLIDINIATTDKNDTSQTLSSEFTDEYFTTEIISTKTNESKIANSSIITTTNLTNLQELTTTTENVSDVTRNVDTAEGSEATSTITSEETTSIAPNSTEQVVVNY